jgi:hypothetical protein
MTVTGGTITATRTTWGGDCIYVDSNVDWTSGLDVKLQGGTFVATRNALRVVDFDNVEVKISGFTVSGGDYTTGETALYGDRLTDKILNVITGGKFDKAVHPSYCAPGYVPVLEPDASGKYTVRLSSTKDIVLIDGEEYTFTNDVTVTNSITYKRTFASGRVNKYNPWFVPFDYTITSDDLDKFDFFKINVISNSRTEGESSSTSNDVWVHIYPLTAGTVLHANKPYVIRPKEAVNDYHFVSSGQNLILKKKTTACVHNLTSGIGDFQFYGTYEATNKDAIMAVTGQTEDNLLFWYIGGNTGGLAWGTKEFSGSFGSYRWFFICIAEDNYAPSFGFIEDSSEATDLNGIEFASDEEIEGYYTLNGVKVQTPAKGVYIVRYNNGVSKKINIK